MKIQDRSNAYGWLGQDETSRSRRNLAVAAASENARPGSATAALGNLFGGTKIAGRPVTAGTKRRKERSRKNWNSLGSRLRALVTMKRQWGDLRDIYETRAESLYELNTLPACTRDPNGTFASIWDLFSVALLLYVSATVPLRAGFEVNLDLWTFGFFFDLAVDIFFICDLVLNFRTAYYDKNGIREDRPLRMAREYLNGWFAIDLVSCLPVGYLSYIMEATESNANAEAEEKGADNTRIIKSIVSPQAPRIAMLHAIKLCKCVLC